MANNEWEWQDRFTFAEQLRRVADNLISKRMEAWNRRQQEQMIVYMDLNILDEALAGTDDDEEGYDPEKLRMDRQFHIADSDEDEKAELYDRAFAAVAGDEELVRFVEAIRICGELDDICD